MNRKKMREDAICTIELLNGISGTNNSIQRLYDLANHILVLTSGYGLGDKVYLYRDEQHKTRIDEASFEVVGIRENELECKGDWSGGAPGICETGWINIKQAKPYIR